MRSYLIIGLMMVGFGFGCSEKYGSEKYGNDSSTSTHSTLTLNGSDE